MKSTCVFLGMVFLLTTACTRTSENEISPVFDVVVQGIGGDCKLPLLDFGSRTTEVGNLIGVTSPSKFYYAVNLDSSYAKAGISLQVKIRKITAGEARACTDLGPFYPSIDVTTASIR
ncbi:hypothetical protein GCM10027085_10010 [Spirosoma aerophilum]